MDETAERKGSSPKDFFKKPSDAPADASPAASTPEASNGGRFGNVKDMLRGKGFLSSKDVANVAPEGFEPVILKRAELVNGATTESGRDVIISSESVKKYTKFLDSYVTNISKIDPDVLQDHDRRMLQMVGKIEYNADGSVSRVTVDRDKIKTYLQQEQSWATTTMLMEQDMLLTDLALAMDDTINKGMEKSRPTINDDTEEVTDKHLNARRIVTTGLKKATIGLAAAGYFTTGRGTMFREFTTDADVMIAIQDECAHNPQFGAYLNAMTGVDINQLAVTNPDPQGLRERMAFARRTQGKLSQQLDSFATPPDQVIEYRRGYRPDVKGLREKNKELGMARNGFYKELGIDMALLRSADEHVYDLARGEEGLPVRHERDVMAEYWEQFDAYEMLVHRHVDHEGEFSKAERAAMKLEARRRVLDRYTQEQLNFMLSEKQKLQEKAQVAADSTSLQAKRDRMEHNPEEVRPINRRALEEQKQNAQEAQADAQRRKAELVDPLPQTDQAVQLLEDTIRSRFPDITFPADGNIQDVLQGRLGVIETDRATQQSNLERLRRDQATAMETHRGQIREATRQAMEAAASAIPPGSRAQISIIEPKFESENAQFEKQMQIQFGDEMDEIKARFQRYDEERDRIRSSITELTTARNEKLSATLRIVGQESNQLQSGRAAYDQFTGGTPPLCAPGVVEAETVQALYTRLDTAGIGANDEERLDWAIRAKAEAKALQEETAHPLPPAQQNAINDAVAASIHVDDLFRNASDLQRTLEAATNPLTRALYTPDEARVIVQNARAGAETLLRRRYAARIDAELTHYQSVIADADRQLTTVPDYGVEIQQIDLVRGVMTAQESLFNRIQEAGGNMAFADMTPVAPTDDQYSQVERDSHAQRRYIDLFHFLYPQARGALNRDQLFTAFTQMLPEAEAYYELNQGPLDVFRMTRMINVMRSRALAL